MLTEAVWPPRTYSVRLVLVDQTRTVQSFDDEASLGDVGFLVRTIRIGLVQTEPSDKRSQVYWFPCEARYPL